MKLQLWIYWLSCFNSLVLQIAGHCLRESPNVALAMLGGSTRHMWQPRPATGALAETGSCNRPTTLRPATDVNVATSQLNGNATTKLTATPVVTLANYVYQCAAKRETSPTDELPAIDEELPTKHLGHKQQMTLPAIVLQLAKSWPCA